VLVPMTNSTLVATWSLPTLVVESETFVGSRVQLVGASISFENNFYRLPFTPPPPSLVHRFGPSTTTVTTTSHRSHEIVVSLGPEGTLVTGMKTEPVTVKLTSEMHSVNLLLLCLDEMRRICFHACLLSLD
jgi:hypothetical protein